MNKQNTSPYYQGDLIFIFLAFFAISVIAIYLLRGNLGSMDLMHGPDRLFTTWSELYVL